MPLHIDRNVVVVDAAGEVIDESNPFPISFVQQVPTDSALTVVAGSTTVVSLLAANPDRLGATIFHEGAASKSIFVALGPGASASNFTFEMKGGSYYEVPFGWRGEITGIWNNVTGAPKAHVTELT